MILIHLLNLPFWDNYSHAMAQISILQVPKKKKKEDAKLSI